MSSANRVFGMFGGNSEVEKSDANSDGSLNGVFGAARTPQFIITTSDGVFHSTMEAYPDYAPCLWFELGAARLQTTDSTGHLTGDGRVVAKTTSVCMKYGSWAPMLHDHLVKGTRIEKVITKRLSSINGACMEVQGTQYVDCYITTYEQRGDKIFFTFSFNKIIDAQIQYDSTGKQVAGVNAFEFDYDKAEVNASPATDFMDA